MTLSFPSSSFSRLALSPNLYKPNRSINKCMIISVSTIPTRGTRNSQSRSLFSQRAQCNVPYCSWEDAPSVRPVTRVPGSPTAASPCPTYYTFAGRCSELYTRFSLTQRGLRIQTLLVTLSDVMFFQSLRFPER